jgi:uncharacterized protein (TIGR02001 family)
MILFILFIPLLAFSGVEAELGAYSDFIWRGTTFTEHRPAIQGEFDFEEENGFYLGSFLSNAEFSDEGLNQYSKVTSEVDVTIGKRWVFSSAEVQIYYSKFFFPGAGVFDTDEWNLQLKHHHVNFEFSLMDDYFGYHSRYTYFRVGYDWSYNQTMDGAFYAGFNYFDREKGSIRSRSTFQTLDGAGNNDYIDLYFVNRKILENNSWIELAVNWTNRNEYSVDSNIISKDPAKDFVIIMAYIIPFTL